MPWAAWLQLALRLGVTPRDFWRLSLAEWRAILGAPQDAGLSGAALAHLMNAFPDKETRSG